MPDITKCIGTNCPLKENCYRYTSKSSHYQSFFMEVPFNKKTNSCEKQIQINLS